eukprot:scaffold154988_cov33-Tisochrysis_lutea.AAC.2
MAHWPRMRLPVEWHPAASERSRKISRPGGDRPGALYLTPIALSRGIPTGGAPRAGHLARHPAHVASLPAQSLVRSLPLQRACPP